MVTLNLNTYTEFDGKWRTFPLRLHLSLSSHYSVDIRLDAEGKELLASIGSSRAKDLGFRDNWVFVGGKKIEHPSRFEKVSPF